MLLDDITDWAIGVFPENAVGMIGLSVARIFINSAWTYEPPGDNCVSEAILMSEYQLEEILHPRSIAVVGASPHSRGPSFVAPLKDLGFQGDIYPVNPKYKEVLGLRDPKRFDRILREATAVKPVVILKGGRGSAGTRATASHTGSMAGAQALWDSMVKQAGAISAEDTEEIVDIAVNLCFAPPILGCRTGVAGGSGGSSVWAADLCEEAGLDVIDLPQEIRDELRRRGSTVWDWIGNPADFSITMGDHTGPMDIMKMMAAHPDFDLLIVFMSAPRGGPGEASIDEHMKQYHLREIAGKPVIVILQSTPSGPPINDTQHLADTLAGMRNYMNREKWPVFPGIKQAANAAVKVIAYYARRPL